MDTSAENAELLTLAAGQLDRISANAFDARVAAVRALFPQLATVVEVVELVGEPATESGIRLGHNMLDLALADHIVTTLGI